MDANTIPTPTPIQIRISPTLSSFNVPLATFKASKPGYSNFAVGTFIFSPSYKSLLLVQRASTERGFPDRWEIPGGSTEDDDPTILHSAAREAFEETGLHLTKLVRQIGEGVEFTTGKGDCVKNWLKLSFEIEVMEMGGGSNEAGGNAQIQLNPEEHQAFVWALEEDIRTGNYAITTPEQQTLMLKAFELAKGKIQVADHMADGASKKDQNAGA